MHPLFVIKKEVYLMIGYQTKSSTSVAIIKH